MGRNNNNNLLDVVNRHVIGAYCWVPEKNSVWIGLPITMKNGQKNNYFLGIQQFSQTLGRKVLLPWS